MASPLPNAHEIATVGTDIYRRKYREDFEAKSRGQFAVIDIKSERAFVADFPEEALRQARIEIPEGTFYLLRIGSPGAFKASRLGTNANSRVI
jgi:hypothetical protein